MTDDKEIDQSIEEAISELCARAHKCSVEHGFYDMGVTERNNGELIALMHSELSEMLEALRLEYPENSKKIPGYTLLEEEAADLAIRLFDFCEARGIFLGAAILAKMEYNELRPYKHRKKF